jgi:hypothetical protein
LALSGKGFYIWAISRTESGNVQAIANLAVQSGLTHTLIKIADGNYPYNIADNGSDLVPPLVQALNSRGLTSWGWHYVYGYDPDAEADIAIQRIQQTGVTGYIIDAEHQYEASGRATVARRFMTRLRAALPNFPVALSSYRYPTYHPAFPFQAFLEKCDYNMPQVYWVEAHNPGEQLARCLREFQAITPFRPIIPTGSAYKQGNWEPTPADLIQFMDTARSLNMPAANFWEWGHTRLYLPALFQVIADYQWQGGPPDTEIVPRYIAALNTHDPSQVLSLYNNESIHVTRSRTYQGLALIERWYTYLLEQYLPNATFVLGDETRRQGSRRFTWTATSSAGNVNDGQDTFGIVDGKIVYHFTMFSVTP